MSASDTFFQFKLALLAMPLEFRDLCNKIAAYGIVSYRNSLEGPSAKREKDTADRLHIKIGSWSGTKSDFAQTERYLASVPYSGSGDATVRLKTTLVFESRDGKALTEREFKILCGIYSALGSKEMRRVTVDEIQRRAAGCVSKEMFSAWAGRGRVYTRKEIRTAVEELHRRGFFARATYGRRLTYYSNRNSETELRDMIVLKHSAEKVKARTNGELDALMTVKVGAAIRPRQEIGDDERF